jgi:hypothetical protein
MFKTAFDLTEDDARSPIGSETGPDLILTSSKARKRIDLAVECKNQKTASLWAWLEQAKSRKGVPALVFHRSKPGVKDIWICVPLEYFLKVKRKALEREGKI